MAVGKMMDIAMALGTFFRFISFVSLLVPATGARHLIEGASTTSPGLMPVDGISPRPTPAPEWNRALNDLRRRADSIISPAPSNWCGFIDGDYDHPLSCGVATSCVFQKGYATCCTNLNTASCFTNIPTTCLDSAIAKNLIISTRSIACSGSDNPFCQVATYSGTNSVFFCGDASVSRFHSLKLLSDFYLTAHITSSLSSSKTPSTTASTSPSTISSSKTPSTNPSTSPSTISSSKTPSTTSLTSPSTISSATLGSTSLNPSTSPSKTIATTIVASLNPSTPPTKTIATIIVSPNAITGNSAPYYKAPAARLPTRAVAGIGIGTGLLILGAIAGIAFFLWRKRKRAPTNPNGHNPDIGNSPTLGGTGPTMVQTNNNMAQEYQNAAHAAHPGSKYVPPSQPPDFIKVSEQLASPPHYSPAPIYTSAQHTSPPLIPHDSNNHTSNMSQYPSPAPAPPPLLSATTGNSPAEFHHQQASPTTFLRDYPPTSPISELGSGEAAVGNFSTPRNHAHEVAGVVPAYFNNANSSAPPLQGIHEAPSLVEPRSEVHNSVVSAQQSSTNSPSPTHTHTDAYGVVDQALAPVEVSPVGQRRPQQRGWEAGARPVEML